MQPMFVLRHGSVVVAFIYQSLAGVKSSPANLLYIILGMFVGRCNDVRRVLRDLGKYEETVARLEKELADSQHPEVPVPW